jgi:hypothetical protein
MRIHRHVEEYVCVWDQNLNPDPNVYLFMDLQVLLRSCSCLLSLALSYLPSRVKRAHTHRKIKDGKVNTSKLFFARIANIVKFVNGLT